MFLVDEETVVYIRSTKKYVMFQKIDKTDASTSSINLLGAGTSIVGDINSNGDMRIDGALKGNLSISGKLVVGSSGVIEGNVSCKNAEIQGEITGKLTVTELLSLKSTSKIIGDIITSKITIEPNALFTGTCNMESTKPLN